MLYQAQEAPEILPAIAAIPELMPQSRRHNDQEYDIIYYLQGGDMWHICAPRHGTELYGSYSVTATLPLKCLAGNIMYLYSVYCVVIVYCTLCADT
jgi:hypothetical protein